MPGLQYRRYYGVNNTQAWNFLIWDQFEMLSMMQPLIMVAAR